MSGSVETREWQLVRGAGIAGLMLLAACGQSESERESLGSAQSAISVSPCVVGAVCKLPYEIPNGVPFAKAPLLAFNQLTLSDGVSVVLEDNTPGSVANSGTGRTELGTGTSVLDVSARGLLSVRSRGKVLGNARAASYEVQQDASVPNRNPAAGAPSTVNFSVTFPTASLGDRNLQPNQVQPITAGRYSGVTVNQGAKLKLAPGVYYFDSLTVESGGSIEVDTRQGTVVVFVRNRMVHRGSLKFVGPTSDALFGFFGTEEVYLEGEFDATVLAPAAGLTIGPAGNNNTTYDGNYWAKNVLVRTTARIKRAFVSATGTALPSVPTDYVPNPNAVAPPVPTTAGKSATEYHNAVGDYIKLLADTGYNGPVKVIDAHPDRVGRERSINSDATTQIPNPPRAPAPGSTDALVATALPGVVADYPETKPDFVPPKDPPTFCPLGTEPNAFPPIATGGGAVGSFKPLDETFGEPKPASVGDFDAWFGGKTVGEYGLDAIPGGKGLYAKLDANFGAGFSVFGQVLDVVVFNAHGHTQTNKPAVGEAIEASAELMLVNGLYDYRWNYANTPSFHGDFCSGDSCRKAPLFPEVAIPFGGIVSISFNAGIEAALPVSFDITRTGPALTFAPMLRVFAIFKASLGQGIRVSAEGNIDLVRVDTPVRASTKINVNTSPSVCKATIAPNVDVRLTFSTLNGEVFIVGEVLAGFKYIEVVRFKLFSWTGFKYEVPIKTLTLPGAELAFDLDENSCNLDTEGCKTIAAQQLAPDQLTPASPAVDVRVTPDQYYDTARTECTGQYVLEIPPEKLTGTNLQVLASWDPTDPAQDGAGNDACAYQRASVQVFGRTTVGGPWVDVNYRKLQGERNAATQVCTAKFVDGGIGEAGQPTGQLPMFFTPTLYPGGLRIAVLGARSCNPVPLSLRLTQVY